MIIRDFDDSQLNIFVNSTENELKRAREPKPGFFMAESPNVIERALNDGYIPQEVLVEEAVTDLPVIQRIIADYDIPVYVASAEQMKSIRGFEMTRGALCLMNRREQITEEELLNKIIVGKQESTVRIAILEDVMNPTNLGAIFRSAAALGMDAVILTGGCSDPLYRRSARVSMGTVFQVPWAWTEDIQKLLEVLKSQGFISVAMALDDRAVRLGDKCLEGHEKMAILLGSEGYGLKEETIKVCDYTVMIPMTLGVDSLNVAAASSVVFWELGSL